MAKPVHVLAIDDEEKILSTIERCLLLEPYRVATTIQTEQAMEILASKEIKVIISDQRMPGVSGVKFLESVKQKYPDIIRILLTGHADMQAAEEAVNIGEVYRFMTKPWNNDDLKSTIRQAIEAYNMTLENRRLFEDSRKANASLIQANTHLQKLYDKQKEFTSTVSHELRTPLTSIKMGLDIVLSGAPGPLTPDQSNFLQRAKSNVDRLNRLINDILDLTKIESGRINMNLLQADLYQTVLESLVPQRSVAENKGLRLECITDPALPLVAFDRDRMLQVLYNLVGNSIKFTDKGFVKVLLKGDPGLNIVTVTIEDSGPGIKPEDIGKLFEEFQQLEGAVNHKVNGTGLGLAICKTIIERHNGKIWVESTYGQGSRFIFTLPVNMPGKE
jgi:signal transduction histidine kinase